MINLIGEGITKFPSIQPNETQIRIESTSIKTIPTNIGQFPLLQILRLRNNKIEFVPKEIGNLKKLTQLFLSNNQINELPNEIGSLTSLVQLRIENNQLVELPREIGDLENLTHLYLNNNKLNYLPPEIKKLNKLVYFSIEGNNFSLPPSYSQTNPFQTIDYILNNQKEKVESLITKKAYCFINANKDNVVERYNNLISEFSKSNEIDFITINSETDINQETNVVFLICPIDTHIDQTLVEKISRLCLEKKIRFYIFSQDKFIENNFESANLDYWKEFQTTKLKLENEFKNEFKTYSSYEQLNNLIFEALKQHKPDIRLKKLTLTNIGHFSHVEIDFDKDITCLIGENGCGKSTILKTLALGIIGPNYKKIEEKSKSNLLKILEYTETSILYKDGTIILDYTIDGDSFTNSIEIIPKDNGNDIIFNLKEDSKIIYNEYNLKSLIVGFPQDRGIDNHGQDSFQVKQSQPHIEDLIPLINGKDDFRLKSFTSWIANLYFDFVKKNKELDGNQSNEEFLIDTAFEIISKITKKEIKFITVTKINPPEIWVKTQDAPNGIPLSLISQGFKIVVSWVGYLMQRFIDTFPLSNPNSAFQESAIVIIDEVDISMHPIWQVSFIEILKDVFPNTQFIISTHDPIIIGGLLKKQVRVLKEHEGLTTVFEPDFDPKGLGVAGILTSELFGLKSTLDIHTLEIMSRRNELLLKQDIGKLSSDEKSELNEIFHNLNSLGINTTDRDPLYEKFIVAVGKRDKFIKQKYSPEEMELQNDIASEILEEILKEQKEQK
ncbi:leucine-rich repeat domain-containing protein [Flavobacterium phycosphaerae]|uniref:leucine-rich repeat domain-containing protein n=1 Tax=Flavobacterium phycosphaerae TaxID=2697515 RepID=UPI00138AB01C|nr:AAA family ATPase [Flavobacterium phycosphaerae]